MAATHDTPDPAAADENAVERLHDHLDRLDRRPDEMQHRLDALGEGIEAARRRAQADDLLPGDERAAGGEDEGLVADMDWPAGDEQRETPLSDADVHPGG